MFGPRNECQFGVAKKKAVVRVRKPFTDDASFVLPTQDVALPDLASQQVATLDKYRKAEMPYADLRTNIRKSLTNVFVLFPINDNLFSYNMQIFKYICLYI